MEFKLTNIREFLNLLDSFLEDIAIYPPNKYKWIYCLLD